MQIVEIHVILVLVLHAHLFRYLAPFLVFEDLLLKDALRETIVRRQECREMQVDINLLLRDDLFDGIVLVVLQIFKRIRLALPKLPAKYQVDPQVGLVVVWIVHARLNGIQAVLQLTVDCEWLILEDVLVGAGGIGVEPARRILKRVIEEELDGLA